VAEVTSLGLVQMTRKRVGEGLLEAFSEPCPTCNGRGVIIHSEPVFKDGAPADADDERPRGKRKRGNAKKQAEPAEAEAPEIREQRLAAMAAIHRAATPGEDGEDGDEEWAAATPGTVEPHPDGATQDEAGSGTAAPDAATPDAVTADASALDAGAPDAGATNASEPSPESRNGRSAPPRRRRRAASRPAGPPQPVSS
jgi:ribonuclease E